MSKCKVGAYIRLSRDEIWYCLGKDMKLSYESKTGKIKEEIGKKNQKREATELDMLKLQTIIESFNDKDLSFTKGPSKIKNSKQKRLIQSFFF